YQFSRFTFLGSKMQYSSVEFVIGFSILFLCGYVLYTRTNLKEIFREKSLWLLLSFFCLSLILSTIFARYKVEAIKYDIRIMATMLLFFLLLQFLSSERLKGFALIVFNVVGIVVAIIGIMEYFGIGSVKEVLRQCQWGIGSRTISATSVFVHNNIFGNYLLLLVFVTLGQLKETRDRAYQILLRASLGLFVFVLVLSLARSAWLAFIVTGFLYLWLKRKDKRVIIWSAILVLFFLVALAGILAAKQRVIGTVSNLGNVRINQALSLRLDLWRTAVIIFENYPILGIGLNNFKDTFPEYTTPDMARWRFHMDHAYNQYVYVLAEQGIFGFVVFMGLAGYLIALGIRNIRRGGNEFFALAMMAYFVGALFDYMWCDYSYLFMFWFVIILNILEKRKLDGVSLRESP
ncbi:MAG: O-antigen ligase family protein, partial [Desulfobacterales bacterium]|nr:O-antigen ligase family protein [Desulfobacterales bacterium]